VAFANHESEVESAVFSLEADLVATITSRGVMRLWNRAGRQLATYSLSDDAIVAASFNIGATMIVSRTRRGFLRRWIIDVDMLLREFTWIDELSEDEALELGFP
jgi:hypothetical protein